MTFSLEIFKKNFFPQGVERNQCVFQRQNKCCCFNPNGKTFILRPHETADIMVISEGPYNTDDIQPNESNEIYAGRKLHEAMGQWQKARQQPRQQRGKEALPRNIWKFMCMMFEGILEGNPDNYYDAFSSRVYWTSFMKKSKKVNPPPSLPQDGRRCFERWFEMELECFSSLSLVVTMSRFVSEYLFERSISYLTRNNPIFAVCDLSKNVQGNTRNMLTRLSPQFLVCPNPSPAAGGSKRMWMEHWAKVGQELGKLF